MSRYIATRAIRGANALVTEAEVMLGRALAEKGADTPVSFPNTAYYLPTILGMTGRTIERIGDLQPVLKQARDMLHPVPAGRHWTPYLGETLDSGMATLLAAETIEAIRFIYGLQPEPMPGFKLAGGTAFTSPDAAGGGDGAELGGHLNGPIDDIQLRSWGIQLVDGRMPGFAAIVGCAKSNEVAVKIVRELQRRNILCFLSGNVNGRSIIHQLQEEGVELGYDTYTVPFGTDTISAIYALGFATRSALTFGGLKPGQSREILLYNKDRVFAFVLALGEVDDLKYAAAAGAINFGFPVIADTVIPEILPTGVTTYEHVVSMPFETIDGKDDLEKAERLVQKCIEVRGVKVKVSNVDVPVPYGSAFEGEVVRKADLRVEFGGKYSRAFEFLQMAKLDEVTDGKIEVIGHDFSQVPAQGSMDMGIIIKVAGRQMQQDFEPVLERQIHYFVNGASGIQHVGQRDIAWIRISANAADKGFGLEHFGKILHARFHEDFGAIVDKVQVTIVTEPPLVAEWLEKARAAYDFRNKRLADLTDDKVEEFYSCTLCQSFAPNHVCVVSPERLGLCGAYNWLDCKASYSINPTGPNQPIKLGKLLDDRKGYWQGTNDYARIGSHGVVQEVTMYSIMENPMTACLTGDAEILVNGQLRPIGDFVNSYSQAPSAVRLHTLSEHGTLTESRLLGVHKNPAPAELIRIETGSGLEVTLTPNHEVAVDRWGEHEHSPWIRADALRAGDRLYAIKHVRLEGRVPLAVDVLRDDCRVADQALLNEIRSALQARYGSLAEAYRAVGLDQPDAWADSMPLKELRLLTEHLDRSWDQTKRCISSVTPAGGHPGMGLPELTPHLLYLLGLLASGGSVDWQGRAECRVTFAHTNQELIQAFAAVYAEHFPPAALQRRSDPGTAGERIELSAQNFLLGLLAEGLGVHMRGEKAWELSRLIALPEAHIAAFLSGVLDGGGSVRAGHGDGTTAGCHFRHPDRQAARHLQMLLKRLGIVGYLKDDLSGGRVELHDADLRRFAEASTARHPQKRAALGQIAALAKAGPDPAQAQVLPYLAGRTLAELQESHAVISPSTLFGYRTGRARPAASSLQLVIDEVPETAAVLMPWLEGDYFLDRITRVETVKNSGQHDYVYNTSLLEVNSYLANGIHVKNCGCFECIVMLIPEANGVMVVSREDTSMTPAGMTFSTLAGIAGGGLQTPGVMGVGKFYLISPKFISADGGFKRVVWMSSVLKQSMGDEFKAVCEREGDPELLDRIADERNVTTVDELLAWLEAHNHPALAMEPMF